MRGPDVEMWLCADPRLAWGKGLVVSGLGPSVLPVPGTAAPCLALSAGLAWGMRGALFSSKAAWRSWGGEPTAQQVSSSFQSCFTISPSMSSAGEGAGGSPGKVCFSSQAVLGSQLHTSWTGVFLPLGFQSLHLLCPERALLLHSYCATAWGNPQTAGRGWGGLETSPQLAPRLPWAKPNLCSNGPATQDSPCACTRAAQCLPLPPALPTRHGGCWHRCHQLHRLLRLLLVLLSARMNHLKLQPLPAPSSGWRTGSPCSAHSQRTQSCSTCSEPAGCSQGVWDCVVSDLPCSSWGQLGTS